MSVPHTVATDATDLDTTAELPMLDVAAYEALAGKEAREHPANEQRSRADARRGGAFDRLAKTQDTVAPQPGSPIEADLKALSANLRDFEKHLAAKGERLGAIEKELDSARELRNEAEQRAVTLAQELSGARAELNQARVETTELRRLLETRETEARQAALRGHALAADLREREQALAAVQLQLREQQVQSAAHLEVLSSLEGRRGVLDTVMRGLDGEISRRDAALGVAQRDLNLGAERVAQLSAQLGVAEQRLRALEAEVAALATALAKKTEEITSATSANAELRNRVRELTSAGALNLERIRTVETDASAQAQAHTAALAATANLQRELEESNATHKRRITTLETELGSTQLRLHESTAALQRAELEHAAALQKKDAEQAGALQRMAVGHASELHALRSEHAAAMENLQAEQAATLAKLQAEHASTLEGLQSAHRVAIEQLERERAEAVDSASYEQDKQHFEHASAVARLRADHAAELQQVESEQAERITRLDASEAQVRELQQQAAELENSVRVLHEELRATRDRTASGDADLRSALESVGRLESQVRSRDERIEALVRGSEDLVRDSDELRSIVAAERQSLAERDELIRRLEQEAAHSSALLDNIQHSMRFLESPANGSGGSEFAPEGATRLLVRTEVGGGSEVVHVLARRTSIGRTPDNDVQVDTKFVSRHHAVIIAGPVHTIIEDLNSTNGLVVNGRRVMRQTLRDGDVLGIGKTQFRFTVRQSGERRTQ